jgi:hypothetical protein
LIDQIKSSTQRNQKKEMKVEERQLKRKSAPIDRSAAN